MAKELLYIDLNYTHHSLSPRTRILTFCIGVILIGTGIWSLTTNSTNNPATTTSAILNIIVAVGALIASMKHLPMFAKKYIRLSDNSIKIKNRLFWPRRKFVWDDIEKIEITRNNLQITTCYSSKIKGFKLFNVSYDDFNTLHKMIVDNCTDRDIDMI